MLFTGHSSVIDRSTIVVNMQHNSSYYAMLVRDNFSPSGKKYFVTVIVGVKWPRVGKTFEQTRGQRVSMKRNIYVFLQCYLILRATSQISDDGERIDNGALIHNNTVLRWTVVRIVVRTAWPATCIVTAMKKVIWTYFLKSNWNILPFVAIRTLSSAVLSQTVDKPDVCKFDPLDLVISLLKGNFRNAYIDW